MIAAATGEGHPVPGDAAAPPAAAPQATPVNDGSEQNRWIGLTVLPVGTSPTTTRGGASPWSTIDAQSAIDLLVQFIRCVLDRRQNGLSSLEDACMRFHRTRDQLFNGNAASVTALTTVARAVWDALANPRLSISTDTLRVFFRHALANNHVPCIMVDGDQRRWAWFVYQNDPNSSAGVWRSVLLLRNATVAQEHGLAQLLRGPSVAAYDDVLGFNDRLAQLLLLPGGGVGALGLPIHAFAY